jgi:hypothetical protein
VVTKTFRAIAETVVPEAAQLDDAGWQAFSAIVERAIAQRPAAMRRQLKLFLRALNLLSYAKHGRALHQLIPSMRTQFLQEIQDSKLMLVRRGFWGVRTLVLMGYYARPEAIPLIGYRAHAHGWEARV